MLSYSSSSHRIHVCIYIWLSICACCLFYVVDSEKSGMADMVFEMIQDADIDTRTEYYRHIVLSGGSSMYPGLPTRLEKDIRDRYLKEVLKGNLPY